MMCVWGNGSMHIIQRGNAVARFEPPFSLYSFRSPVIETLLLKTRRREQVENNDCFLSVTPHRKSMLELRTRLPKLIVTNTELFYACEFNVDEELFLLGFALPDLSGVDFSYMLVIRAGRLPRY
jgi:hypothetical protein